MDAATVYLTPSRLQKGIFILIGALNFYSGWQQLADGASPLYYLLSVGTGVVFFSLSFFQLGHDNSDYYLRADGDGIRIKRQFRRMLSLPWQGIEAVRVADRALVVVERSGTQHKVALRPLPKGHTLDLRAELQVIVSKYAQRNDVAFSYEV